MSTGSSARRRAEHAVRSTPAWSVFGVSAAVLSAVVVVLVVFAFQTRDPAAPVARTPGQVRQIDGQFFVPVDIVNRGDSGAAEVQVLAELTVAGVTTSADQVIDFLGRDETQQLTFVFTDDPAAGELTIGVAGFAEP